MPFTFSHPAIVIPITFLPRQWVSVTGLIIGSLTPDFEYFFRMKIESQYSHTIAGLFWFDLPLGILLAFLFHNVVRNTLFLNLPFLLQSRLIDYIKFEWDKYFIKHWLVIVISTLIGAASHLLWDSFTHENGYFIETSSLLQGQIQLFGNSISKFKILQHSSTIIGAMILTISLYKLPISNIAKNPISLKYWFTILIIATATVAARAILVPTTIQLGNLVVTSITGIMLGLIISSLAVSMLSKRK